MFVTILGEENHVLLKTGDSPVKPRTAPTAVYQLDKHVPAKIPRCVRWIPTPSADQSLTTAW